MGKISNEVEKAQELFKQIIDTDIYEISDNNGNALKLSGEELKAYIISMRGQVEVTDFINKSEKNPNTEKNATAQKYEQKVEQKK